MQSEEGWTREGTGNGKRETRRSEGKERKGKKEGRVREGRIEDWLTGGEREGKEVNEEGGKGGAGEKD